MQDNFYGTKKKPEGLKQAYPHSFKDGSGKIKPGIVYYIHTFHTDRWERYTTSECTNIQRLMPFITQMRVFIAEQEKPVQKKKSSKGNLNLY